MSATRRNVSLKLKSRLLASSEAERKDPTASPASLPPSSDILLSVQNLTVKYKTQKEEVTALRNVSLDIGHSQIVAIVGESGCGKSTFGLSIIRLLPIPPAQFQSGRIMFNDRNLLSAKRSEMSRLRGTSISMIFQEPMTSLDPVYTVGDQVAEAIRIREGRKARISYGPHVMGSIPPSRLHESSSSPPEVHSNVSRMLGSNVLRRFMLNGHYVEQATDAMKRVKIPDPERVLDKYPHELSGGMAQRVMIAQALLERPSLLIADEPTSALDVTTQAEVLTLMRNLRDEIGSSIFFVTHDLAVAAQIADRVIVMYAGEIMEDTNVIEIFENPQHPYTEGLIRSFPRIYKDEGKMEAIPGDTPDLRIVPKGCPFEPRCEYRFQRCIAERPELKTVKTGHSVACFRHDSG